VLEAVIFDFDGVVVDSEPVHMACFRQVLQAEYGLGFTDREYYDKYLAYTDAECFAQILRENGRVFSDEDIRRLGRRKTALVQEMLSRSVDPLPGAIELMRAARDAGVALAICSAALREEIELPLLRAKALELVQVIVSAEDVHAGKPDPAGYNLARWRLSEIVGREIPPGFCVAIEDSPGGILAARAANLHVLAVTNTVSADALTAADRVAASLAGLTLEDLRKLI
jgi:beta-phosphoglucomutase